MSERGERPIFSGVLRLIPYSGVQFVDAEISVHAVARTHCLFIEDTFEHDGESSRILLPIEAPTSPATADATEPPIAPRFSHPVTGRILEPSSILRIEASDAVAAFAGQWLPIPYLRFVGRDDTGNPKFDTGPGNWARAFIERPTDATSTTSLTVALDTALERHSRLDAETYLTPTIEDASFGSTFFFASSLDDIAPLLAEPWFENWLRSAHRPAESASADFQYRHVAAYLTLLRVISATGALPEVRFTDTIERRFPLRVAPVDIVLDIGEAETAALLVDVSQSEYGSATGYAEPLRLRDLQAPAVQYDGPFPTAVEFDRAPFGDAALSHASGRIDAFAWPSLVRVGQEARRLALRRTGTEGVTGLSNLRSFLMDEHPSPGLWRQSTDDDASRHTGPMVAGSVLGLIGEDGSVLGSGTEGHAQRPAIRPHFSRASMIGFFAAEIVLHALAQANRAGRDTSDDHDSDVRELRQIVLLAPTTSSPQERQALASRVEQGVALVWRALGWEQAAPGIPHMPPVTLGVGGDLGMQIAFLHDEAVSKYQGRFGDLMRIWRRNDVGADTAYALRVASIDFGARTTTAAIIDYAAAEAPVTGDWQSSIRFQERVPAGTDAVVQSLIWSIVLPAIERALQAAGLAPARHFLDEITGRSNTSLLIEDPYFARRLNRKILWPAGHGLLRIVEHGAASLTHGNRAVRLATLVEVGGGRLDGIADAFDAAALQAGARGFTLREPLIPMERGAAQRIVRTEMQQVIHQVTKSVAANTCDLLLLSGEGARLSAVMGEILSLLPVPAGRIVDLETYTNTAATDAMGGMALLSGATMLPAIASAFDLKDQLAGSGLIGPSMRQLAIAGSNASTRAIGSAQRGEAQSPAQEPPGFGRAAALPSKGG